MARTLTPKQEAFAQAYVANGGKKQQSALDAGYAQESAAVDAHRLLTKTHVLDRIHELTHSAFSALAPTLMDKLVKLASGARSEKVKFDALKDLLDRSGHRPVERVLNMSAQSPSDVKALQDRAKELLDGLNKQANTFQDDSSGGKTSSDDVTDTSSVH